MPANVGEMFYTGQVPWHGEGLALSKPATMEEALRAGGLNWEVGEVDLLTCDDPPSPVFKRKAIVRLDRAPGDERRVLGVTHLGFKPLQNHDGARLFDAIFGKGKRVYHTGGYLGNGEVVWMLAKIDRQMNINGEIVEPYALFSNSHDGSLAFSIGLTTIRVVCQNTLSLALKEKGLGEQFRRAHQGSYQDHAEAARQFWLSTVQQLDRVTQEFIGLAKAKCEEEQFKSILESLLPIPPKPKPRNVERNPGLLKAYETKMADIEHSRKEITRLRMDGKGMDLESADGTFWGVLNAITEYVDYHREINGDRVSYALLGDGRDLKMKAYRLVQEHANMAA